MNLEQLISRLKRCTQTAEVEFDFCRCVPTRVDSWRGVYAELALGWSADWRSVPVSGLLANLESAVGATFEGWKGGNYKMEGNTTVWVDNPGECTHTTITGLVEVDDYTVIIETRRQYE